MADNKKRSNGKDKAFRRPRKKVCQFCADKSQEIDYKDVEKLKRFVSEKGKILNSEEQDEVRLAEIEKNLELLYAEGYAKIDGKANEVMEKIKNGEDFEALLKEYGEDTDMKDGQTYTVYEGSNFVEEFIDASLKLKNISSTPFK